MPRSRLLALFLLLAAGTARGENRVETYSPDGFPKGVTPALIELDVSEKFSLGIRETGLGVRDTNEIFFRLESKKQNGALDPRDKRQAGMNNPLKALGSIHLGVVGVETDGTRGMPLSIRAGMFGMSRLGSRGIMGITELSYQSGTFGGDVTQKQNKGGLFTRWGMRKDFKSSWYTEADYTFSPGNDDDWVPRLRFGVTF